MKVLKYTICSLVILLGMSVMSFAQQPTPKNDPPPKKDPPVVVVKDKDKDKPKDDNKDNKPNKPEEFVLISNKLKFD